MELARFQCPPNTLLSGRFLLAEPIGSGGGGVVFRAVDQAMDLQPVAVKVLHPELAKDDQMLARFLAEAGTALGFVHPHIVRVISYGRTPEDLYFMAMELIEGENLRSLINRRNEEDETLNRKIEILIAVARALEYAHRFAIVHRDVKPDNVLLGDDGSVKLTDFGFARPLHIERYLTRPGETVGSASYMSPEQLRGDKLDARADMYSFGVLAFELLSGVRPFNAPTWQEVAQLQLTAKFPLLPENVEAPDWLRQLLKKTTEKDRTRRYSSLSEVASILSKNLYELPK